MSVSPDAAAARAISIAIKTDWPSDEIYGVSMTDTDGLDPRTALWTPLVNDIPQAGLGTQAHSAGAPVIVMNVVPTEEYGDLVFSAPSASAIALMRAIESASAAITAKAAIEFKPTVFLGKPQTQIDNDVALFNLIDNFFVSAIFSFLAIEAFANEVMDGTPNVLIPQSKKNAKGQTVTLQLPAKQLERESTEFKLDIALPKILMMSSPKGQGLWGKFVHLQRTRNEVVHAKGRNIRPGTTGSANLGKANLYYRALINDPISYPADALAIIEYFAPQIKRLGRWPTDLRVRIDQMTENHRT
jgi:hypothetical protein